MSRIYCRIRRLIVSLTRVAPCCALCIAPCLAAFQPATAQERTATITVKGNRIGNKIASALYGQFVEIMFGGVEGSLWGELVRNRSFEQPANEIGLSRYWEREPDDRNHDPAPHFHWDDSVTYPSSRPGGAVQHSMQIEVTRNQWNAQQRRGISQGKMPIRANVPYRGYFWLKTAGFDGHVTVALEQDRTEGAIYATTDVRPNGDGWAKYEFKLAPDTTDPLAKLSILIHGVGKVWLDDISLLPGDAVAGMPVQVFERVKALRPSLIRWPGGNVAQDYYWMRGVGPRDERPSWNNRAWWNETETSDYGTDEFIALCRALGTEPSITVNVEGSGTTAQEAAAWVRDGPLA